MIPQIFPLRDRETKTSVSQCLYSKAMSERLFEDINENILLLSLSFSAPEELKKLFTLEFANGVGLLQKMRSDHFSASVKT